MDGSRKTLNSVINVAIVLLAVGLGIVCVKKYLPATATVAPVVPVTVGKTISIADVDWSRSRRTFLIALQEGCHFCTESAPFYKRLMASASHNENLRLIAVLPQDPNAGRHYLDSLGVSIVDVKSSELTKIGITGTPTLLLLDDHGSVRAFWVGKLSVDQENEVLRRVEEIGLN